MLAIAGLVVLALFSLAVVFGEVRGWLLLMFAFILGGPFAYLAFYCIKREFDRLERLKTTAAADSELLAAPAPDMTN